MADAGQAQRQAQEGALGRACAWLPAQAQDGFSECLHVMQFPQAAGFTGADARQASDLFARASIANLLLDIAEGVPQQAGALRALARREADYLAGARQAHRGGGWSYFPGLPELPPDADSLAAVVGLFARIAPEHLALCEGPVQIALDAMAADGSLETWLIAPTDAAADRACMQRGIRDYWGSGTDADVLAAFCLALLRWSPQRFAAAIERGVGKLLDLQQPDGSWRATWYSGPAYATGLVTRLLRSTGRGADACDKALDCLLRSQNPDGSWGRGVTVPLQTALSMIALDGAPPGPAASAIGRGAEVLQRWQDDDGSWPPSPWIRMEIGRASGTVLHVAVYQSLVVTAACCAKALVLAAQVQG